MGFLGRKDRDTDSRWWKYAADVMQRDEQRVTYAHLKCFDSHGGLDGTLFLTNRQIIWRVTSPGPGKGDGFQQRLEDILAMGRDGDDTPGVFVLGVTIHGQQGA